MTSTPSPDSHAVPEAHRMTVPSSWHLIWETELDRIELDVRLAERMLRSSDLDPDPRPLSAWAPPAIAVPMPDDLLPRARLLHERQLAVAHALTSRLASTVRHQALTERMRENSPPDVPVYVDVSA